MIDSFYFYYYYYSPIKLVTDKRARSLRKFSRRVFLTHKHTHKHTHTHTHTHVCTVSVTANFSQRQTRRIRSTEPRLKAVKTASANVFTSFSSRYKLEIRRLITWPLMATMSDPTAVIYPSVCYKSNWVAAVNKGKIPAIKILRRR